MDKWQPIRTAPKNGIEIILYCPKRGVRIGRYSHTKHVDNDVVTYEKKFWWTGEMACFGEDPSPTHWMSVPKPPKGTGGL